MDSSSSASTRRPFERKSTGLDIPVSSKGQYDVTASPVPDEEAPERDGSTSNSDHDHHVHPNGLVNTAQDDLDMQRLGKVQQFKRNFSLWSSIGFVAIYMATWEFVLVSLSVGFSNGGYAGLFWCFITTTVAYSTVVASLAEMASMAPTSGGQYREYPRSYLGLM